MLSQVQPLCNISSKLSINTGITRSDAIKAIQCFLLFYAVIKEGSGLYQDVWFEERLKKIVLKLGYLPGEMAARIADAGFTDCNSYGADVMCFCCGLKLRDFNSGTDPSYIHAVLSPECMFLNIVYGKSYINECLKKSKSNSLSVNEDKESLLIDHLVNRADAFRTSTQFQVAREFDYSESLCFSMFLSQFLSKRRAYKRADQLIMELENAIYGVTPTLLIKDIEKFLNVLSKNPHVTEIRPIEQANSEGATSLDVSDSTAVAGPSSSSSLRATDRLQEETQKLYSLSRCRKCKKNQADHVILPCSELSICGACLQEVNHCPSCGCKIVETIQTYM